MPPKNRWWLAGNSYLALMGYALGFTIFGPLVSVLQKYFTAGEAAVASIYGFYSVGFLFAVTLGGPMVERFGLKPVMITGSGVFALGLGIFGRSATLGQAYFWMTITGFAGGLVEVGVNTTISTVFPENRAFYMNLLHVFFGVGAIIGPRLVPCFLGAGFQWGTIYLFVAAPSAMAFVLAALLQYPPAQRKVVKLNGGAGSGPELIKSRFLWAAGIMMTFYVGAEVCINNWSPLYMETVVKISKQAAAANISNFWFAIAAGRLLCVPAAKKLHARNLLLILSLGSFIAFILFLALPLPTPGFFTIILTGLFLSGIFATAVAIVGDRFPNAIGKVTGIMMFSMGAGNLLFPWATGLIGQIWGLAAGLALVVVLLGALLALALVMARRPRQQA